ncbi:uroporphyrinogen-III C-methyltransferase [bacterium Unc6]|nr:uroporphyrinogen-III C-methyltransferase [bacterium Unc6]
MKGKVYLVGAGPGKPDLITVRGLNILKESDVVIYDYLVDKSLLGYTKDGAELICCDELGKKRYANGFLVHQNKINNLLIRKAKEEKKVARLKNGDPSIFSRYSQELEVLTKNKIEFEVVPGVTAAVAAAGLSGIPLTDRKLASSCVFVTGHEDPTKKESLLDWDSLAKIGTLVLYMAIENLDEIVSKLLKCGRDENTPVAIIQDASLITQRILTSTLKNIAKKAKEQGLKPPAIVIVGKIAKLEKEFNWLRKGKWVLFTGLSQERFFNKGVYFHLPLIKIEPLYNYREFDNYVENIRNFDWIVFASRYGVEYFFKRLKAIGYDSRLLSNIKIGAIGNSTKNRLLDFGIIADLVPKKESAEGLVTEFKNLDIEGKRIFLPRSDISDKGLEKAFKKLGARVTTSFAYKNVMPEDLPDLELNTFNEIMFTSPSAVRNFKRRYKKIPQSVKVRCIGDVTLKEAKKWHLID